MSKKEKREAIIKDFDTMFATLNEIESRVNKVISDYRKELTDRRRQALWEARAE